MTTSEVNLILDRISKLQCLDDEAFQYGLFPSFRSNKQWAYRRKDSNIFATASTLFVLKGLFIYLSNPQKELIESLNSRASEVFDKYQNMHGGITYNFWQTKPSQHFPHGKLLKRFKHFKLPDDIDDTALIYMVQNRTKEEVLLLRQKIIKHSKALVTGQKYAYNTWFGENMPYENDVCALCNLLYLFLDTGLPLCEEDLATLAFVADGIRSKSYISEPFRQARHYASTPLIIYHFARLMGSFEIPSLLAEKQTLIQETLKLFAKETNEMNKLVLHTSLIRLGHHIPLKTNEEELFAAKFYPFKGAPFAPFSNFLSKRIASKPWAIINWECEALKLAYIVENEILRRNFI